MDPDRKSAVSSFYGGRKSSFDALNPDVQSPMSPNYASHVSAERAPLDSSSSFFDPNRASRASFGKPAAGYNNGSFFPGAREEPLKGGRDEEDGGDGSAWDVYADFNNAGPKYSTAFSIGDAGYRQIPTPDTKLIDTSSVNGPVEMVTVPALGPEWKADEMRNMTKAGKREKINEGRKLKWKQWRRDERGICGKWFKRRFLVFFLFGLCVAIGIVLAFTIPRVPVFSFNNDTPLVAATPPFNNTIPAQFSRAPVNFTFPAVVDIQVDTGSNYLPLTFNHLRAQVFDLDTNMLVGTGDLGHKTLPAKSFPIIQLPLNFTYVATNQTDPTWTNWYNACRNSALYINGTRPGVNFRLVLNMDIAGLPTSHIDSTSVSDAPCPIELSQNSA